MNKNQKTDVVCIGQALVDCIIQGKVPHKKNVYRADSISLNVGGDAFNESVVLTCLGRRVRLICGLGEDPAGNLVYDTAGKYGVDVSRVYRLRELTTPIANLVVSRDGSRYSVNSPATMLEGFVPDSRGIQGARVVSLASLFRAPFDRKETIEEMIRAAKAEGAVVCADTKLPTFRELRLGDLSEILPMIDYIFPNENEAAYHAGMELPEDPSGEDFMRIAEKIRSMGVKNVIVKTGPKGCTVCGEKEAFHLEAEPVAAVDSTGAGDNFVAGFIDGLLRGEDLRACCVRGTHQAACSVQAVGAVTAAVQNRTRNGGEK